MLRAGRAGRIAKRLAARLDAEFDSYCFWGSNYGDVNERTFTAGTQRVTEHLAGWFVGNRPTTGGGPREARFPRLSVQLSDT